ncbi:transglutaminase domain-containing protein [Nocardioides glacieisoli]|uniref:Transglutaminase domain-containing protein n=1 Tax=Nocardioides glacieisoli TaxID=1168730 RepID=A0A4Q2RSG5_9ACTN|nr:transglutaminase domain-containing protein [Nocardioides glacieisoli]RYB90864.1 transglutaminase domain-containing protein [Nocardioides glacieisoli]
MTRRRGTFVDAVVVVGVMAAILSIFEDTFADRSYLTAGLVPVVLLVVLALLARRTAEGGWWYFLGALVLLAPVGAVAALRDPGPFLVPTLDSMTRVLVQSVHAPTTLVSTVPPVAPSGQALLVPFLIGFLATAAAAWLALGTTRALAPVVPLLLALGATIPLGVLVPTLLVPRGILVALTLLVWAAHRARRREAVVEGSRGSVAAAVTMAVTVASVSGLALLLVPDDDESDRVLLSGEGNSPLLSAAARSTMPFEPRRDDTRLLRVTGVPDGRRLRLAVLDRYDGDAWVPAEQSPGSGGYGTYKRIGEEVAALHPGPTIVVRVRFLPGWSSDWLPLLGELTRLDFAWNPGRTEVDDVRYNQATGTALVVGGIDPRDEYAFEAVPGKDTLPRRGATREPSDEQRQPEGAFLDSYLEPFDHDDLLPLEKVLLLARYLSLNGTVRRTEAFDQSADALGRRMLGLRRPSGSAFQYSALMALGASRLGVPARMVTGAEPGPGGRVDYADVTSWVELQMDDGTWRPLKLERYLGTYLPAEGDEQVDAPPPDTFVAEQLDNAAKGRDDDIRPPRGSRNPDGTVVDPPPSPGQVLTAVAVITTSVVVVALLLVPVVKVLRRRRRRSAGGWSGPYVNGWQEVLDAARDRGTPVPDTWSRVAQARQLGAGMDLARRADAAVFAPGPGTTEDAEDFWRSCEGVRRALLAEVTGRRRVWAQLTPASLLAGWARRRAIGPPVRAGHGGTEHPLPVQRRPVRAGDA